MKLFFGKNGEFYGPNGLSGLVKGFFEGTKMFLRESFKPVSASIRCPDRFHPFFWIAS